MQSSLWKFVKGGNPPDKKRKKDDKEAYYKEYEASKRSRTYLKEWEKGRSWLHDTDDGMICLICKEFGDQNVMNQFISGCVSYKLDSVQKHQKSKGHEKAVLLYNAKNETKSKSQAAKIVQTLNNENIEKLDLMFRNVHAMVQHNRPLNDYVWLCDLDEMKCLKLGNTYRNSKSANSFVKAIAETEFKSVASTISTSKFNCLIGDGSTDTSVKEQEMWYVRSAKGGEISVNFIGVKNVERANAQNIVSGIKDLLTENILLNYNDVIKKTVALSCDGASVMVGCRSGVSALLKADQPSIITLHCMAHRLELALKDASKNVKLYDKTVSVLCMGLYYFYHNSALNRAMLYRSYDALRADDDSLLIPTKAGGTRWIGHALRCVTNLTTSYKFIVGHLGQLSEPIERVSVDSKAKGIAFLKLLKSKDVVCFLHLLMDVLEVLRRMSLILQDRTSVIGEQHNIMATTLDVLKKYQTSDGPHLRKVMNQNEFQGTSLNYCNIVEFTAARKTFLSNIIEAISKRFSEFSETAVTSVVSSTRIANFRIWPKTWDSLKEFGDKELQVILDHFRTVLVDVGVNVEDAETEWTILKKEVLDLELLTETVDWKLINQRAGQYKNILCVFDLILTMSPSSSEAERGFSQLKLIKTDIRSNLGQVALNHSLAIKLLSAPVKQFNPLESIQHWNTSSPRSRRPTLKDRLGNNLHDVDHVLRLEGEREGNEVQEAEENEIQVLDEESVCEKGERVSEREKEVNELLDDMERIRKKMGHKDDDEEEETDSEVEDELNEQCVYEKLL